MSLGGDPTCSQPASHVRSWDEVGWGRAEWGGSCLLNTELSLAKPNGQSWVGAGRGLVEWGCSCVLNTELSHAKPKGKS